MPEKIKFSTKFEGYELTYYMLHTRQLGGFGVGIKSQKNGIIKTSECYNITSVEHEAFDFLCFLMKTATFPTTLNNMVEDWIFDKQL